MESKEKKLTNEQKYFQSQIEDLKQKEQALNFQLDQVRASLLVFNNSFTQSTKDVAEEVLKEKKSEDDKKGEK
tara:strand:- start:155 stop:373 length:219 start_codon:yes stop_codon:yes gene_type:complete